MFPTNKPSDFDNLQANSSMGSLTACSFGAEQVPVHVFDWAHPDPAGLLRAAQTSTFYRRNNDSYPGLRAAVPDGYRIWLAAFLNRWMSAESLVLDATFAMACDNPADLAPIQRIPHFDTVEPDIVALVHYLNPGNQGGTGFYRQRSTGFERIDADRLQPWRDALTFDCREHGMPDNQFIGDSTAMFERTGLIDFAENRLIAYPANCLHSGDLKRSSLSADPRTGRLTITSLARCAKQLHQKAD